MPVSGLRKKKRNVCSVTRGGCCFQRGKFPVWLMSSGSYKHEVSLYRFNMIKSFARPLLLLQRLFPVLWSVYE